MFMLLLLIKKRCCKVGSKSGQYKPRYHCCCYCFCCLDVVGDDEFVAVDPRNLPLQLDQNCASNSNCGVDIADIEFIIYMSNPTLLV